MRKRLVRLALALVAVFLITNTVATASVTLPASRSICAPSQRALSFLTSQYNPVTGLLRESTDVAPNVYWLANDNALAANAFDAYGESGWSAKVRQGATKYGPLTNGLIETVWGASVAWPPRVASDITVVNTDGAAVRQESHLAGLQFEDWRDYANLALLGALNQWAHGDAAGARGTYREAMQMFDGVGFADKASAPNRYETYKIALAILVGSRIGATDRLGDLISILLAKQLGNGGFVSLYDRMGPKGDANTETTSFALLALREAQVCR